MNRLGIKPRGTRLALPVDPLTAILIAVLIIWSAVILLRESGAISFQQSPIDLDKVRTSILKLDGVAGIEDLHVWALSSQIAVASVHVTDAAETVDERDALINRIHEKLQAEYSITHSTVEIVSYQHEHALS